jgi:hypothetical protein
MKKQMIRTLFSILFFGFVLVIPLSQALAAYVTASASFDWNRSPGGFTVVGGAIWTSQGTGTNAVASNNTGETQLNSDYQSGWVSSSSVASISNANTQSLVGSDSWKPSATSQANLTGYGWSNGTGNSILTGVFTANVNGWVFITVPYTVSVDLSALGDPVVSPYGKATALLSLSQSGGSVSTDTMEIISTAYGLNSKSGFLGVMKYFLAGETGTFTAEVSTEANVSNTVPLPGAFLLLGPGLVCIVIFRRRFTKI